MDDYRLILKTLNTINDVIDLRNDRDNWKHLCQEMVIHISRYPDHPETIRLVSKFNNLILG